MSQEGILSLSANPSIPTSFVTDSGIAVPVANVLNIFGGNDITTAGAGNTVTISFTGTITGNSGGPLSPAGGNWNIFGASVAAGTTPVTTAGAGSTLTVEVQTAQAIASTDATKIGLAAFNSTDFTVDANGFTSLSANVLLTLTGNSGGAVAPTTSNINTVGTGSITVVGNPGTSTLTTQLTGLTNHAVLVGAGTATITNLAVGANGAVLLGATGADPAFALLTSANSTILFTTGVNSLSLDVNPAKVGETITGNSGGALSPTLGNWNILGTSVAAGTTPVSTSGAASTLTVNVQTAQAIAATDATKIGLAAFNNTEFTVDANGFVGLLGGSEAIDSIAVQTGTSPILPTVAGLVTINGATVAAGTNPVRTDGTGANTMAVEVQISQAIAATDATKIGLSNFNSSYFTVDANGFVAPNGSGLIETITGNSGGAESPTGGNFNILGTGSITVAGSANTETVQLTGLTNHAVLVGAGTATITKVGPSASTGQILQNNAAADPSYSTATYPSTTTINQILYSSSANTVVGLATANGGVFDTSSSGVPQVDTTNFAVLSTGVQVKGNNTNTAPPAGFIGEYISSLATAFVLTTATPANAATITVTPGIWNIDVLANFNCAGNTLVSVAAGPSSTSATFGTLGDAYLTQGSNTAFAAQFLSTTVSNWRFLASVNTTIYFVAYATFTVGCTVTGRISATRVG